MRQDFCNDGQAWWASWGRNVLLSFNEAVDDMFNGSCLSHTAETWLNSRGWNDHSDYIVVKPAALLQSEMTSDSRRWHIWNMCFFSLLLFRWINMCLNPLCQLSGTQPKVSYLFIFGSLFWICEPKFRDFWLLVDFFPISPLFPHRLLRARDPRCFKSTQCDERLYLSTGIRGTFFTWNTPWKDIPEVSPPGAWGGIRDCENKGLPPPHLTVLQ